MQCSDVIKMCAFDSSLEKQLENGQVEQQRPLCPFLAVVIRLKSKISAYLNIWMTKLYTQLKSYPFTFSIYVSLL